MDCGIRGPGFGYRHQQIFMQQLLCVNFLRDENKEKVSRNGPIKKLFLAILSQARTIKLRLNDNACWCFFVGFCNRIFFLREDSCSVWEFKELKQWSSFLNKIKCRKNCHFDVEKIWTKPLTRLDSNFGLPNYKSIF